MMHNSNAGIVAHSSHFYQEAKSRLQFIIGSELADKIENKITTEMKEFSCCLQEEANLVAQLKLTKKVIELLSSQLAAEKPDSLEREHIAQAINMQSSKYRAYCDEDKAASRKTRKASNKLCLAAAQKAYDEYKAMSGKGIDSQQRINDLEAIISLLDGINDLQTQEFQQQLIAVKSVRLLNYLKQKACLVDLTKNSPKLSEIKELCLDAIEAKSQEISLRQEITKQKKSWSHNIGLFRILSSAEDDCFYNEVSLILYAIEKTLSLSAASNKV